MAAALLSLAFAGISCRSVVPHPTGEGGGSIHPGPGVEAERMALMAEWMIAVEEGAPIERLISILEKLVRKDPDQEIYYFSLGRLLLEADQAERAVAVLEQGRTRFPRSLPIREFLSLSYQRLNRPADARRVLEEAIRLVPTEGRLYGTLSVVLQMDGRTNEAFEVLARGLQQGTDNSFLLGWLDELGRGFALAGETELVIRCYRLYVEYKPEDPRAREMLAVGLTLAGRHEEALAEWRWLEAHQPNIPDWSHRVGQTLDELGRFEEAVEAYGRAIQKPGAEMASWIRQALANARLGRAEAAGRSLEEAAERFSDHPAPHMVEGMLKCAERRWGEAVAAFERAESRMTGPEEGQDLFSASPEFYYWYGVALDQMGEYAKSEMKLRRAIQMRSDYHEALNHLAYQWAERGTNLVEARELSLRSLEIRPEEPAYWDTLGWIYFKKGELTNALDWVGRAAAQVHDPEIADHMGEILWALGREEEALEWWRRSLAVDPENQAVRRKLEEKKRSRSSPPTTHLP